MFDLQYPAKSHGHLSENTYLQNNQPSSTTSTMLRRASLTTISGNKTLTKELDLLTKGKITGQAELGATPTQISRSSHHHKRSFRKALHCTLRIRKAFINYFSSS
jgi:hypothetical protein